MKHNDDDNDQADQMIQVKFGKDGFRRGRIDYNSTGVLRTKPGKI
jgi:hypothetical protein